MKAFRLALKRMKESGEFERIISYLKKEGRFIEARKAEKYYHALNSVNLDKVSGIPLLHLCNSAEILKSAIYHMRFVEENPNEDSNN